MNWLITGAAGAIGGALARAVRKRDPNARLTLVDIDEHGLKTLADAVGESVEMARWDLSEPESLAAAWTAIDPPVDVLVNCAGVMQMRAVADIEWPVADALMQIDLISPLRLLALAAPEMRARGHGAIINIASVAGLTPLRGCAHYGAAKAGLAMASEIARLELDPHGVRVLTVYPGPVHSALEQGARAQIPPTLASRLLPTGDADTLARLILRALDRDRPRVLYPRSYALAWGATRFSSWVTSRGSPAPH